MSLLSLVVYLLLWISIGSLAGRIVLGSQGRPWWQTLGLGFVGAQGGEWMSVLLSINPTTTVGLLLSKVVLGTVVAVAMLLALRSLRRRA